MQSATQGVSTASPGRADEGRAEGRVTRRCYRAPHREAGRGSRLARRPMRGGEVAMAREPALGDVSNRGVPAIASRGAAPPHGADGTRREQASVDHPPL